MYCPMFYIVSYDLNKNKIKKHKNWSYFSYSTFEISFQGSCIFHLSCVLLQENYLFIYSFILSLFLCLSPVGVISTEVTYVLGGLVFAWIVEEWVWDYAITVTLLHVVMTVAGKYTRAHTHTHTHACRCGSIGWNNWEDCRHISRYWGLRYMSRHDGTIS